MRDCDTCGGPFDEHIPSGDPNILWCPVYGSDHHARERASWDLEDRRRLVWMPEDIRYLDSAGLSDEAETRTPQEIENLQRRATQYTLSLSLAEVDALREIRERHGGSLNAYERDLLDRTLRRIQAQRKTKWVERLLTGVPRGRGRSVP
jgi:hypothetical protein